MTRNRPFFVPKKRIATYNLFKTENRFCSHTFIYEISLTVKIEINLAVSFQKSCQNARRTK